jgi:hypothetical protein
MLTPSGTPLVRRGRRRVRPSFVPQWVVCVAAGVAVEQSPFAVHRRSNETALRVGALVVDRLAEALSRTGASLRAGSPWLTKV